MESSVLSFLKSEWKVSDTGSAYWASSFYVPATKWLGHKKYSVTHVRNSEIKQLSPLF